ncbi:MAG: hypothetical protein R3B51_13510 [Thermodesulfobacteriota bacterium]
MYSIHAGSIMTATSPERLRLKPFSTRARGPVVKSAPLSSAAVTASATPGSVRR